MSASAGEDDAQFRAALATLSRVRSRPEIRVVEAPAPQRLAPFSMALTAEVVIDEEEMGTGRLVLLHDPRGQPAWEGTFRVVAFVKATLEPEIAADPVLTEVGWSWLREALAERAGGYTALCATVTRVTSEAFGGLEGRPMEGQLEIRASWTPRDLDLGRHLMAWTDVLGQAAGLPPLPPGVIPLPRPR